MNKNQKYCSANLQIIKCNNKKGELTTQQLVTLIILITSFAIILFLLYRLNLGETSEKEICHNSVILQSKTKGIAGPLNCKTNYVCISGKGECENFNPSKTINIDLTKKSARNEIMKAIAEEMADCWWMFGEGKVNYVGTEITQFHCPICSVIKFDKNIQKNENIQTIDYQSFYNYLIQTKKENKETYFQYLYHSNSIEKITSENQLKKFDITTSKIDFSKRYTILTGMNHDLNIFDWNKDDYIHTYFIESDKINQNTLCEIFDITKA